MKLPNTLEIELAFKNTNFGETPKENVIIDTLTKIAQGYNVGSTSRLICIELGLINYSHSKDHLSLTERGCCYINKYKFNGNI
jgi:hypothetical protein